MKYHVETLEDFAFASEEELHQDLQTAQAEEDALNQFVPTTYEEGQELERSRDAVERRLEATQAELRRRA